MNDIEKLLKQAELFEKLAMYGDRKSFLRALAQEATHGVSPQVQAKLVSLDKDLQFVAIDETLKNKMADAAAGRLDVNTIRSVLQGVLAGLPPDHAFLGEAVKEILAMLA